MGLSGLISTLGFASCGNMPLKSHFPTQYAWKKVNFKWKMVASLHFWENNQGKYHFLIFTVFSQWQWVVCSQTEIIFSLFSSNSKPNCREEKSIFPPLVKKTGFFFTRGGKQDFSSQQLGYEFLEKRDQKVKRTHISFY